MIRIESDIVRIPVRFLRAPFRGQWPHRSSTIEPISTRVGALTLLLAGEMMRILPSLPIRMKAPSSVLSLLIRLSGTHNLSRFKTTNEALYGRAGYLSLLAYVKSTFEEDAHQVDNIITPYSSTLTGSHLSLGSTVWYVVEAILNDGIRNGKNINGKFVMRWEWYNTEYLAKVLFSLTK